MGIMFILIITKMSKCNPIHKQLAKENLKTSPFFHLIFSWDYCNQCHHIYKPYQPINEHVIAYYGEFIIDSQMIVQ